MDIKWRDVDGDVWEGQEDGSYICHEMDSYCPDFDFLHDVWGPLEEVED